MAVIFMGLLLGERWLGPAHGDKFGDALAAKRAPPGVSTRGAYAAPLRGEFFPLVSRLFNTA
jgi:hypothetical protein